MEFKADTNKLTKEISTHLKIATKSVSFQSPNVVEIFGFIEDGYRDTGAGTWKIQTNMGDNDFITVPEAAILGWSINRGQRERYSFFLNKAFDSQMCKLPTINGTKDVAVRDLFQAISDDCDEGANYASDITKNLGCPGNNAKIQRRINARLLVNPK